MNVKRFNSLMQLIYLKIRRMEIQAFSNNMFRIPIECLVVNGDPWFRAKDVARNLGYSDPKQAISDNVHADDKKKMGELMGGLADSPLNSEGGSDTGTLNRKDMITNYINEAGLYSLIFLSRRPEAIAFKRWVASEVLPSIRKHGTYSVERPVLLDKQIQLLDEKDLHYKVIDFLRKQYPQVITIAGLGELQKDSNTRVDAYRKGYTAGQCDLIIPNLHKKYNGICLEFKTPNGRGVLSEKQKAFLKQMEASNYMVLVSNNYDEILMTLINYLNDSRLSCDYCARRFKTRTTLGNHCRVMHRIAAH